MRSKYKDSLDKARRKAAQEAARLRARASGPSACNPSRRARGAVHTPRRGTARVATVGKTRFHPVIYPVKPPTSVATSAGVLPAAASGIKPTGRPSLDTLRFCPLLEYYITTPVGTECGARSERRPDAPSQRRRCCGRRNGQAIREAGRGKGKDTRDPQSRYYARSRYHSGAGMRGSRGATFLHNPPREIHLSLLAHSRAWRGRGRGKGRRRKRRRRDGEGRKGAGRRSSPSYSARRRDAPDEGRTSVMMFSRSRVLLRILAKFFEEKERGAICAVLFRWQIGFIPLLEVLQRCNSTEPQTLRVLFVVA
ncbi:Protein of unknown function [Gryllus bimaculatus]|nr:Protein of unknown function [Gryllus bimaculatus]